jgi:hydroxymethylpyrimidine pyrophosphatase-like HAD family hydrolase
VIFASDLDRTLIHPYRTLPSGRLGEAPVAEIYEGRPITVCSLATLSLLDELAALDAFVAVTTRSLHQLQRVAPIWERASRSWAICANGATLLSHGVVDAEWKAVVDALCGGAASVGEATEAVQRAFGSEGWLLRLRDCDERFLYAVCELALLPEGVAAAASEAMRPLGWEAVLHGRKLYLLPAGLTKLRCVEFLVERLGVSGFAAAGDSLLDAELLAAADCAWCPRDAELVAWDAVPGGVRITDGEHIDAAEEIAREALEWCTAKEATTCRST